MKKQMRVFTALVMLVVFSFVFAVPAMAEADPLVEGNVYTPEALKMLAAIEEKSATSGVVSIDQGESHTAVLFADGKVMAFQCDGWFGMCFEHKECNTTYWSGIQQIACRAECTIGLKKDGSIIWTGKPEICGFDSGSDSFDAGWKKISTGRNYIDIASEPYMSLYALNKNGTVDIAFDRDEFPGVKNLTDVIDIESYSYEYMRYLITLSSDGTVRKFYQWSDQCETYTCKGAVKICVRENKICAIMNNGSVKYLADSIADSGSKAEVIANLRSKGNVTSCWAPDSCAGYITNRYVARTNQDKVYLVRMDYHGNQTVTEQSDWKNLANTYEFTLDLPTASGENKWSSIQRLDVILGVMDDGLLKADFGIF